MPYADPEKRREAGMRAEEKRKNTRFRMWEFIVFRDLDEVNPYWREKLNKVFYKFALYVSPIHQDYRKEHNHVLVYSKLLKTREEIESLIKEIAPLGNSAGTFIGIPRIEPSDPQDISKRLRYFIHADLNGKARPQYHPDDFYLVGTADPIRKIKWTAEEKDLFTQDMLECAKRENVGNMDELIKYFANSRLYTYMLEQARVKDRLNYYFSALKEMKRDEQIEYLIRQMELMTQSSMELNERHRQESITKIYNDQSFENPF